MNIQKYEDVLRQFCTKQLGEIRAVYYSDGFSKADPYSDGPEKMDKDELLSLGAAFKQLGSVLEYGASLINVLEGTGIDLTAEQYAEMLNNQNTLIEQGQSMEGSGPCIDMCRDHLEEYLADHGLLGR